MAAFQLDFDKEFEENLLEIAQDMLGCFPCEANKEDETATATAGPTRLPLPLPLRNHPPR